MFSRIQVVFRYRDSQLYVTETENYLDLLSLIQRWAYVCVTKFMLYFSVIDISSLGVNWFGLVLCI